MASNGFYDTDPYGDPFCPPPVPSSTPVSSSLANPFAQPEPVASPTNIAGSSALMLTAAMVAAATPHHSISSSKGTGMFPSTSLSSFSNAPTPVGNPFDEEEDVFAASPAIVPQSVRASPAIPAHGGASFAAVLPASASSPITLSSPIVPQVLSPESQQATLASKSPAKPSPDASEFDPYSPTKKAVPTVVAPASSQPVVAAAKEGDDLNIEWKADEDKNKKEKEQERVKKQDPVKLTTATTTKTTTASSPIKAVEAETTSAPAKLPDGVLLARVTQRSIFVREWKPVYWIIVNKRLWIYRSRSDYRPTDYIKDPFNERIKKCIPIRDSLRVTEMKSKIYPGEKRTLYTFGIEDMDEDGGGKSLVSKFAAYSYDDLRTLREELDRRVFEARHGTK